MTDTDSLLNTPLAGVHAARGARMVPFAGYRMPLAYAGGIIQEHLATRSGATLFDVCHMGQVLVEGPAAALETLVPGDLAALAPWHGRYSVLTDDAGGILDDLMITRVPEGWFLVVNAASAAADLAYLQAALPAGARAHRLPGRALLALQGPAAAGVLAALAPAAVALDFLQAVRCDIAGLPCQVHRAGYTGEDGFEVALASEHAAVLAEQLLAQAAVQPAGLGARDSLRLEAGLCLAGTDINTGTSPVEAGLGFVVAGKYRRGTAAARFPGAGRVLAELAAGPSRRRVGLRIAGRVPLRGGTTLHSIDGREVGHVTSGTFGPSVGAPVAMGYVASDCALPGTALEVTIRERSHAVTVCALPFVPHRYHRS